MTDAIDDSLQEMDRNGTRREFQSDQLRLIDLQFSLGVADTALAIRERFVCSVARETRSAIRIHSHWRRQPKRVECGGLPFSPMVSVCVAEPSVTFETTAY